MASVAAVVAVTAGIGLGVAAGSQGIRTPGGDLLRSVGLGGVVGGEDLPPVSDIPPPIDTTTVTAAQEIIKKRRVGAIGVLERRGGKSGKSFAGLLQQTQTRGGLLVG